MSNAYPAALRSHVYVLDLCHANTVDDGADVDRQHTCKSHKRLELLQQQTRRQQYNILKNHQAIQIRAPLAADHLTQTRDEEGSDTGTRRAVPVI